MLKRVFLVLSIFIVTSCGGGGGGGGGGNTPTTPSTPLPTVNLSAEPTSVLLESTSTLTWSSTNANSCSASWTNQTGSSGSEAVTISTAGNNSFSITCTGAGGSRSATVTVEGYRNTDGVVVDGYISGAEVCIDEDESWTCDTNESSTTSDNDGKFTIKYANGNLVSIGGTDLDSQTLLDNLLITHKLTGHSDFKAVTPVTSVVAFMTDASLVNAALGIDSSIDISTFDPVANKGDGGVNDYLYEKGNQLTVLAYALQNITNNLNTTTETTQDYFKAITEEIEKEYTETTTKVDIETQEFITKTLDNIVAAKTVTITDEAKANTTKALSGVMPVIEVKSSDDLTTSVIRFAVSTLQTDIQAIANGAATAETIASYTSDVLTYIAEDQNIEADEIAPDISAIADSATTSEDTSVTINVVVNDSYLTSAPISVSAGNGSNGITTLAESSPEQIVYTPNADYNGADTFSYTITQGDKTSSADVSITIEAVNDAPSIDTASTIQVAENQTAVTTIAVSDVDEDELTLSLSGTDVDSFNLSTDNVLTFKEAPDFETKSSYLIALSLTDSIETVTKDITIVVTNVNDVAPVFTSEATFSTAENQTAIGSVVVTDAEGDEITFTVSGSELAITPTGVLTFVSTPDFETKTSYTATVTATDGANPVTQDITVNVTNVNDVAPVFTSEATFSAAENQTAIGTITATDAEGDSVTFTVSGTELAITSTGVLTFSLKPDYETKAIYIATVTASDGINSTTQDITITVNDIDENGNAPVINSSSTFNADENQTAIGTVTATDANGDNITFTVSGTELSITSAGVLTFVSAPDYEIRSSYTATVTASDGSNSTTQDIIIRINNVNDVPPEFTSNATFSAEENQIDIDILTATDADGDNITFTVSGSELSITSAGVLTFVSAPDYEIRSSYTATVTASDGVNSTTQDITVNVTNVNDVAPVFTSEATFSAAENQTAIGTIAATDAEGDAVTFTVSGSELSITSTGVLTFVSAPDYEIRSSYTATVTASDGSNSTTQDITITVNDIDENGNAPVINSSSTFNADENQTAIGTVTATDADGDNITFTVSGTELSITSAGVLTFVSAPDYEIRSSYTATVTASDGSNSTTQDIIIRINNVNDVPPAFGSTEYSVIEQETDIGAINISDGDGDSISLSLSGDDVNAFILDSVLRTIKFVNPPIYEAKNTYQTSITAFDGNYSSSKTLIVNITELSNLPTHPQATFGTDGDDSLKGDDSEYNILIGGRGDDILTGGENEGSSGGYVTDIFQFTNDSGNDIITDFFIQELWVPENQCARYDSKDGRCVSDRLEITTNINNSGISSANEILENSTDNSNGYAVINLGEGNTITLEGVAINEIKPEHIHIIPSKAKVVQGQGKFSYESPSDQDDIIEPLQFNTRMEGSEAPFNRIDDGYDILNSGIGNDILIGGTNDNNQGGVIDFYKFYGSSGDDLIIGYYDMQFSRELDSGYTTNRQGSGRRSDKIIIPININESSIDSFADIKLRSSNNLDGWARLDLGSSNYITVHGVPIEKLTSDSFIFTYTESYNEIYGENINTLFEQKNNFIQGTSSNDWISGSKRFLPWRGDGIDYIFPGSGDDILISGTPAGASSSLLFETFYTTNFFINKPGKKTIIGFSARGSEIYNSITESMLDRVFIQTNGSNNYLSELSVKYDDDGFLTLLIDSETEIKFHSIDQGEIDLSNIILHKPFDSYKYGTTDNDYLSGSSGNDYIDGWGEYKIAPPTCKGIASGSDILEGMEGDDVLVGGPSFHWCQGFNRDTFKFSNSSGNDTIVDFTSNFELPGRVNFFLHMDVLEIEENINGISFNTAQELLNISTNNKDGFAQIQLGGLNTITLHDKSISTLSPMHFRIIPKIDSYIVGTDGDDVLTGDEFNNYIKGSNINLDRYSDGYDVLDGGAGDDVLDGGNYLKSNGGYVIDIYKFDKNYGYDRIFNFFAKDIRESYGGTTYTYREAGIRSNKIEIPNDVVTSATTVINSSTNNADGYAHLTFSGTDIIIHMLTKDQLKPDYFFITPRTSNNITGTNKSDYLTGSDSNDRIQGSINPFVKDSDGSDFIEGGKGDDTLIGGPAERYNGGYESNKYRFNNDFGNDYLISFFAEDLDQSSGYYSNPDGDGAAKLSDKLEFNNIFGSTATDIINNASNNEDGWAVISLGTNSLTIYGVSSEDLKPDYFYIIPTIENTILGSDGNAEETHIGTSGNDYIQGGYDSIGWNSDGPDILNGKEGDDVLIGGPNARSNGGFETDTYIFEANSGNDLIIGFLFDGTGYSSEYNDIIQIPDNVNGSGISSFNDILNSTSDNDDGWAVINLGSGNTITLHGVSKSKLFNRNFIIR